jgi:micrococcal nuclease
MSCVLTPQIVTLGSSITLLLSLFTPPAVAQDRTSTLKVVRVHDGDSLTCLTDDNRQIKVRLDAIDAPELGQPFGQASKKALSEIVFGKVVTVVEKNKDRWGRTVAHVLVDGKDTNLMMLEQGLAWHYTEYSNNKRLQHAEDEARTARKGLWSDREPMPPWDWRKNEREQRAAR